MNALFVFPVSDEKKELLKSTGANCIFKTDYTKDDLKNADVVFGNPDPKELEGTNIKWLQLASAGANQYCGIDDSIVLTNCSGAYDEAISEYMIGFTLSVIKKLYNYYDNQKKKDWHSLGMVKCMSELTVVCVGMGNIGKRYARLMHMLGAKVYGVNRSVHEKPDYIEDLYTMDNMDEILAKADVVTTSLPETKETIHLFNYDKLHKIKKGALLINVGRGSAIDENDLVKVLKEKHLEACCMDVCEVEPLPKTSELWDLDNVYITPHITGGNNTNASINNIADIFYRNLLHYVNNEKLENIVNKQRGY